MCPNCRAFITTDDKVCPYCQFTVGPKAVDRRNPADALGGLIPHARFTTMLIMLINTGLYVAMGWVGLIAAAPLFERMSVAGLTWLIAGGLSYTVGAIVFLFDSKRRYVHLVWHGFVMGGSACHFLAALRYAGG